MASDALSSKVSIFQESLKDGVRLLCLKLASGQVTASDLLVLKQAIESAPLDAPVFLISEHSALPLLEPTEEQAWIIAAGEYRKAQECFKAQGGQIVSLVTQTLTGGTYLVHGMSARHRLIFEDTKVYPALPAETYEAIFHSPYTHPTDTRTALNKGVVTQITTPALLAETLVELIIKHC